MTVSSRKIMVGADVVEQVFRCSDSSAKIVTDGGSNIKVTPLYGVHGMFFEGFAYLKSS